MCVPWTHTGSGWEQAGGCCPAAWGWQEGELVKENMNSREFTITGKHLICCLIKLKSRQREQMGAIPLQPTSCGFLSCFMVPGAVSVGHPKKEPLRSAWRCTAQWVLGRSQWDGSSEGGPVLQPWQWQQPGGLNTAAVPWQGHSGRDLPGGRLILGVLRRGYFGPFALSESPAIFQSTRAISMAE